MFAVTGCDGCEKKASSSDAAAISRGPSIVAPETRAEADASSAAVAVADAGTKKHEMSNCPTSVPGAEVVIKDVNGGVDVTITGKDEATTKEIRERVAKLGAADA